MTCQPVFAVKVATVCYHRGDTAPAPRGSSGLYHDYSISSGPLILSLGIMPMAEPKGIKRGLWLGFIVWSGPSNNSFLQAKQNNSVESELPFVLEDWLTHMCGVREREHVQSHHSLCCHLCLQVPCTHCPTHYWFFLLWWGNLGTPVWSLSRHSS